MLFEPDSFRDRHLDYPISTLSAIPPQTLFSEPFDTNPNPHPTILQASQTTLPLSEKLALLQHLTPADRLSFFSSLTLAEWDESGDWILERFSELIGRMKNARKDRRDLTSKFEEEVQGRWRDVEGQGERLGAGLRKMRKGGGKVLAGEEGSE